MLIVGSQALKAHGLLPEGRSVMDYDWICTFGEMQERVKSFYENFKVLSHYPISENIWVLEINPDDKPLIIEFEIAWEGSSAHKLLQICDALKEYSTVIAQPEVLYALKMSHRFLRNSPHFKKTMDDIFWLRSKGHGQIPEFLKDWMIQREKETYTYSHPKLNRKKEEFFAGDGVTYVYDHDSLHEAVKLQDKPAYNYFKPFESEVWTDKKLFHACPHEIKLASVYEESAVLALERAVVPFDTAHQKAFRIALEKVCTSITSGWYRDWAWEHYYEVIELWKSVGESRYFQDFREGLSNGTVKPYKTPALIGYI